MVENRSDRFRYKTRFVSNSRPILGHSQNHLAVAGGCRAAFALGAYGVPTRYREVVLTVSKHELGLFSANSVLEALQHPNVHTLLLGVVQDRLRLRLGDLLPFQHRRPKVR